jgi:hypothetical protein
VWNLLVDASTVVTETAVSAVVAGAPATVVAQIPAPASEMGEEQPGEQA